MEKNPCKIIVSGKLKKDEILKIQKKLLLLSFRTSILKGLKGIDYYRMIEYPLTFILINHFFANRKRIHVLDVGSSDTIFPLWLAYCGYKTTAIDIDSKVLLLKKYAKKLKINLLTPEIQDVTTLRYIDESFDVVTAISSIEHVLPTEDGDINGMKEIARVLKPGGMAIITVPYASKFEIEWRKHPFNGKYLMRRYDTRTIFTRLIKPTGLSLAAMLYICDDKNFAHIWYKYFLTYFFRPLSFAFANKYLSVRKEPKNAKTAVIVLKREI